VLSSGSVEKTSWEETSAREVSGRGSNRRTGAATLRSLRAVRIRGRASCKRPAPRICLHRAKAGNSGQTPLSSSQGRELLEISESEQNQFPLNNLTSGGQVSTSYVRNSPESVDVTDEGFMQAEDTLSDIGTICDCVRESFDVIEEKSYPNDAEAGSQYKSERFVCKLSKDRIDLPEYALKKKVRRSMNSKQGSRYIKRRMGNDLKQKILAYNGIVPPPEIERKPSVISCPRCNLVNAVKNKYCSGCTYPLVPSAFEVRKLEEKHDDEMRKMDQKSNNIMSIIQENPKLLNVKTEFHRKRELKLVRRRFGMQIPNRGMKNCLSYLIPFALLPLIKEIGGTTESKKELINLVLNSRIKLDSQWVSR